MPIGERIAALMQGKGLNQSDLANAVGVPRQLLSYVISGKREMSLSLCLRLESYFSLPEGELMRLQATEQVRQRKLALKGQLCKSLIEGNALWSYNVEHADVIPDEEIVEQTFRVLDLDDIAKLFEIYTYSFVKKTWRERMAVQGDYLFRLNVMIAMYYFGIKNPERYLHRAEKEHIKKICKDD